MVLSADMRAFTSELFERLGPLTFKPMFSGAAVSTFGKTFALILQGELWIKVDPETEERFEAAGSPRFTYRRKDGRQVEVGYRRLPETAMDDPEEATMWAKLGLDAADRAADRKRPRRRRAQ